MEEIKHYKLSMRTSIAIGAYIATTGYLLANNITIPWWWIIMGIIVFAVD